MSVPDGEERLNGGRVVVVVFGVAIVAGTRVSKYVKSWRTVDDGIIEQMRDLKRERRRVLIFVPKVDARDIEYPLEGKVWKGELRECYSDRHARVVSVLCPSMRPMS